MATPGWYPDPGGAPGRFRYWDGQAWSPRTSATPGGAPPGAPADGTPTGRGRRRLGLWIVVAAVVVVLAVVVALVVRSLDERTVVNAPAPTTTVSGGTDSTPTASPSPSDVVSPTPSPSPTPAPSGPQPSAAPCPVGDPLNRQPHSADGRIHGGGLSMPLQSGWTYPGTGSDQFTWAYDVGETDVRVQQDWSATYAVGALSVVDGFDSPQNAAELSMECTLTSSLYAKVTSRRDVVSQATTVAGYPAWTLRTEIRIDDPRTTVAGDVVQITVVDVGAPESLAFFWGCAPIGDQALISRLNQTGARLRTD